MVSFFTEKPRKHMASGGLNSRRNAIVGQAVCTNRQTTEPPDSPTLRQCQLCPATFFGSLLLQRHVAVVHSRHSKPWVERSYFT